MLLLLHVFKAVYGILVEWVFCYSSLGFDQLFPELLVCLFLCISASHDNIAFQSMFGHHVISKHRTLLCILCQTAHLIQQRLEQSLRKCLTLCLVHG